MFFDLKPVTKYDSNAVNWDTQRTLTTSDNYVIVQSLTEQLCKEQWIYGDTAVACVKIQANMTRKFKTDETTNPPDDIELTYSKFIMHAQIGSLTGNVIEVLNFAEQSVDFNTFNLPPSGARIGFATSAAALVSGILLTLF